MPTTPNVARTAAEAERLELEPLIVIEPLTAFLDSASLGTGPLTATPIGSGHSNVTYALDRGNDRFVLRRPPRGPLSPSTHDVLREARLLRALAATGVRVPEVLVTNEDPTVIGSPFYVMRHIEGHVFDNELPPQLVAQGSGQLIGQQLVDALVELHGVDIGRPEIASLGRPSGYLARQVRRFRDLLGQNSTRQLPELDRVADWLHDNAPETPSSTIVHGDYRLGNVMFAIDQPPRLVALLDWEMSTLGDPLADLGYMVASWAESGDEPDPMLALSAVTRGPGFPTRAALAQRYAERTGRDVSNLHWYRTLAVWKAAIFLEGSYRRYLAGTTDDHYFAQLEMGVPLLARRALSASEQQW